MKPNNSKVFSGCANASPNLQLIQKGIYNFAVFRAYYAMFYVAEALLDHEGLAFSSHAAVISAFGQTFAKTSKLLNELHRQLIDAQAQRTRVDYDPNPDLSQRG